MGGVWVRGRRRVKFDYSAHTMARRLMIPLHLGKRRSADLRRSRRVTQVWPSVRREIIRPPSSLPPTTILISNTLIFPAQISSMNIPGCSLFVGGRVGGCWWGWGRLSRFHPFRWSHSLLKAELNGPDQSMTTGTQWRPANASLPSFQPPDRQP